MSIKIIAFNLSALTEKQRGVKVHIVNLTKYIYKYLEENSIKVIVYTTNEGYKLLDENFVKKSSIVKLKYSPTNKLLKLIWEQFYIPFHAYLHNVDLIHSFDYTIPLLFRKTKTVTIHDMNFIYNPKSFNKGAKFIRKFFYYFSIKRSKIIFTVSHTSQKQIHEKYKKILMSKKIEVIYNGFEHKEPKEKINVLRNLPQNFFLSVGTISYHKNYENLIYAFQKVPDNFSLVIVGKDGGDLKRIKEIIKKTKLEKKVIIYTDVKDEELDVIFKKTTAVVLPSKYEGFGIPLLEALSYKKDVLCSNIDVFKEIGGDYVSFFNPNDFGSIAKSINTYLNKKENFVNDKNIVKLLEKFDWNNSSKKLAEELIKVI